MLKSKSSIVAINVSILVSQSIVEITFTPLTFVFTFKPVGALRLSGETLLATALAVFSSAKLTSIFAFSFTALQLFFS
jgi:hypothetical protein